MKQMQQLRYASRGDALGFALRTKKNLAFIERAAQDHEDVHVVTQLVNSLLGLVVFPWERGFAEQLERLPVAQLIKEGWPAWDVSEGVEESRYLGKLLRRVRNGIAHGHLTFSSNSLAPAEVTITVEDWTHRKNENEEWIPVLRWRGEIRTDHLREFCYRFIDRVDQVLG